MFRSIVALSTCVLLAACGGGGSSGSSGGDTGGIPDLGDLVAPAKPTGLVATAGTQQVALGWAANVETDLSYYSVYRWEGIADPAVIATVAAPAHAFTATSLVNGTSYSFQVTAHDRAGNASPASDPASATPLAAAQLASHDGLGPVAVGTVAEVTTVSLTAWNDGGFPTGAIQPSVSGPDAAFFTSVTGCGPLAGGASCTATLQFTGTVARSYGATVTLSATPGGSFSRAVTVTRGFRVDLGWTADGVVSSEPPGLSCGGAESECSKVFDPAAAVTLVASLSSGYLFQGWTATGATIACPYATRRCGPLPRQNVTVVPVFVADGGHNRAFVSSETFPATLTVAEYDAACNRLARAAGLDPSNGAQDLYVAFLAGGGSTARARLESAVPGLTPATWRGWVRVDGRPVADTSADVDAGNLHYPIMLDELGRLGYGAVRTTLSCGTGSAWVGKSTDAGGWFQAYTTSTCSTPGRIYCLSRGRTDALGSLSTTTGKRIWITSGTLVPSSGLAGLDAHCQAYRPAGVATAKAFVSTTTAAAASRLAPGAVYVNTKGQRVGDAALFGANYFYVLDAGYWYDESGNWRFEQVATGARGAYQRAVASESCSDWSGTAGSLLAGYSASTSTNYFYTGLRLCTAAYSLICFEE